MSVFGQQSQTLTEMAKQLGHSDHLLKAQYRGSAPMDNSITAESWLPGTTGVHCNVTHGDQCEHYKGDMTQHFHGKKDSTYHGEFTETYNDLVTRHMYAPTKEHYFASKDTSHFATASTDNTVLNATSDNKIFSWTALKVSAVEGSVSVTGIAASFTEINVKVNSFYDFTVGFQSINVTEKVCELAGWKTEAMVAKKKAAVLKETIGELKFDIAALDSELGELSFKTRAAGIHEGPGLLHTHSLP